MMCNSNDSAILKSNSGNLLHQFLSLFVHTKNTIVSIVKTMNMANKEVKLTRW